MIQPPSAAITLALRAFREVLPLSARELAHWREQAAQIPDPELRKQALASLSAKRFHADGGTVYATAARKEDQQTLISLIVAFQTISDYLDNLCDRSTSLDPDDFRQLHLAMLDSVTPDSEPGDYYRYRTEREDGGYLTQLVKNCQDNIARLPGYSAVAPSVRRLVELYADLQVHKHVTPEERVPRLTAWHAEKGADTPDLDWWEFAAATGSTLGVFMLFLAALDADLTPQDARAIVNAYFPWVCGLHILLDYLIDMEEDELGGDLNFVSYYPSLERGYQRIEQFAKAAQAAIDDLPHPRFHRLIIQGLIGMYLSDDKVLGHAPHREFARHLSAEMGRSASLFHWVSRYYRKKFND
ncbi:MAG: tetraprenyl-beta-curcumene synthase family protein [Tumebacillaceae bacterium]